MGEDAGAGSPTNGYFSGMHHSLLLAGVLLLALVACSDPQPATDPAAEKAAILATLNAETVAAFSRDHDAWQDKREIEGMHKFTLLILALMLSFFSKGQSNLEDRIAASTAEMNVRNVYQRIVWGMSTRNAYVFDQEQGAVRYTVNDRGYEVVARPVILGTFNLEDKTFLWADKNASINGKLSERVASFRASLPPNYRKDKFQSDVNFNEDLLAVFSYELDANAFDSKRQDSMLIYYALLEVVIYQQGKESLRLAPGNHVTFIQDSTYTELIKAFHASKVEVNKLHEAGAIDHEEAFDRTTSVHLTYWLNEDPYFFPALTWPCDFDEVSILDWKTFRTDADRTFVMYTSDLGWTTKTTAYELDVTAPGSKLIVAEY